MKINEALIRRAWRQKTSEGAAAPARERLVEGLAADSSAQQCRAAVAVMAEDALAADIGRIALALEGDASALSREVASRRRSRGWNRPSRWVAGTLALAAMLALAAVLVLPRPGGDMAPFSPESSAVNEGVILSSSFDEAPEQGQRQDSPSDRVFRGSFDS